MKVNPATGLPMMGGIDISGNSLGHNRNRDNNSYDDDYEYSNEDNEKLSPLADVLTSIFALCVIGLMFYTVTSRERLDSFFAFFGF